MEGIPAFLDCDFDMNISPSVDCQFPQRSCFIDSIQLGPAGIQVSNNEALLGLPVTEFKVPGFIINFKVSNVSILNAGSTFPLSPFHKLYDDQFTNGAPNIRMIKGYEVRIALNNERFSSLKGDGYLFHGCRFSKPISRELNSAGQGILSYSVPVSFRDFSFVDKATLMHSNSSMVKDQLIFRSIEAGLVALQQFV